QFTIPGKKYRAEAKVAPASCRQSRAHLALALNKAAAAKKATAAFQLQKLSLRSLRLKAFAFSRSPNRCPASNPMPPNKRGPHHRNHQKANHAGLRPNTPTGQPIIPVKHRTHQMPRLYRPTVGHGIKKCL